MRSGCPVTAPAEASGAPLPGRLLIAPGRPRGGMVGRLDVPKEAIEDDFPDQGSIVWPYPNVCPLVREPYAFR